MSDGVPWSVGHRRLERWLRHRALSTTEFARLCGLRSMVIRHIRKGRRTASLRTAVLIDAATDGAVQPLHWTEQA